MSTDRGDEERSDLHAALKRYRVTSGEHFRLAEHASDDLPGGFEKERSKDLLRDRVERLSALQENLYVDGRWSLLVILQAMDAGGKDSTIKHVMSGVNPQGVSVTSFKAPGPQELAHGFLWRISGALPERGRIGIFNRSQYEDVLVARVHKQVLEASHLPDALIAGDGFWHNRIADIAAFEGYLGRQGTRIVKIFLNISEAEQKRRLLRRLERPEKTWKFAPSDLKERASWNDYRDAYQAAIAGTAAPEAPWYVVPADRKWYARLVVAEAIVVALEGLDLRRPQPTAADREELAKARQALERD